VQHWAKVALEKIALGKQSEALRSTEAMIA
jgi:hypothetical protein